MIIVCDSSPVVALAICDSLNMLDMLFAEVIIPERVYAELTVPNKPESIKIARWAQEKIVQARNPHLLQALNVSLDAGESEAMALYWEQSADFLLVDEKKGRKIAALNGMKVIGTLGILLLAKQKGLLPEIKPMLTLLQNSAIRISDVLYHRALVLAGENNGEN
jgi:predicted nucleic acid-binding protein